jgi:hypothetical protein
MRFTSCNRNAAYCAKTVARPVHNVKAAGLQVESRVVEQAFGQALNQINLDDMVRYAESMATELVGTKAA